MSRFKRLSHVIGHCQYHIIWVPKYRFRILKGPVAEEVYNCIQVFCAQLKCEIIVVRVRLAPSENIFVAKHFCIGIQGKA
jgi:putative transposase